jgi:RNA polymerase sigma factor (sigma-70 family)
MAMDQLLIERANQGDEEARGLLFLEAHRFIARTFAGNVTRTGIESEDVASHVVISLVERFDQLAFSDVPRFRAFLWGAASQYILDRRRHQIASKRDIRRTFPLAVDIPSADDTVATVIAREVRVQMLSQLVPQEREIIWRKEAGHTTREIADHLHVVPETVQRAVKAIGDRFNVWPSPAKPTSARCPRRRP